MFDPYLARWGLVADGEPIVTPSSRLLPVRRGTEPAMLKIALEAEERFGGGLMAWWQGDGAARVLGQEDGGGVLLLERAEGRRSLAEMARGGQDDEASRVICGVVARLHAPRERPLPELIPLERWFRALQPAAAWYGGILEEAAETARGLLAAPEDVGVLHGDIHHGNVLDFGPRGWLAVDPKRLCGERGFDYANLFTNPDLAVATAPGRLVRQASVVAEAAGLDRARLLRWVLSWSGLSAAWQLEAGEAPEHSLAVARLAASDLRGHMNFL